MKKMLLLFMGVMLIMLFSFLMGPAQEAEAAGNTFTDIIKIDREEFPISRLDVYEDILITTSRGTSAGELDLISSYNKKGVLLWEKHLQKPYKFVEDYLVTADDKSFLIYSTVTGKLLKRENFLSYFTFLNPKIYMNEDYIAFYGSTPYGPQIVVYNTDGKYVEQYNPSAFDGAAFYKDFIIIQDRAAIYAVAISNGEKVWQVDVDTYWNNDTDLIPKDGKIFVWGVPGKPDYSATPPHDSIFAVDAETGKVLYKKTFSQYMDTIILQKDFGFIFAHPVEDIFHFFNFDGTLNKTLSLESKMIKQLKQKYQVSDEYHTFGFNFIRSKEGFYAFRRYSGIDVDYSFSTIKILDKTGYVKFEKIIDEDVFGIATTKSNKLFVARGLESGSYSKGYKSESNELDVYDPTGKLLDTMETEYMPSLVSDGYNLYGYGSKMLYIFKESEDVTPPPVPTVKMMRDSSKVVEGSAQTRSKIYVYAGGKKLGETVAKKGVYSLKIAKQKGGTHIAVYAEDGSGNRSASAKTTVFEKSIQVKSTDFDHLKISWPQVAGADGYDIYRSYYSSRNFEKIATVTKGSTLSYTNSDVWMGTTYYYKVRFYRMVDGKKEYGFYSSIGSGEPNFKAVSVKATPAGYSKNKVEWPLVNGTASYMLYRATEKNGTYKKIKTLSCIFPCKYEDTGLTAGTTYYYKVRAYTYLYDKNLYGPYSSIVSATPALAKPSKITVAKMSSTSVKASWSKVGEASGYELYRATSKSGTYTKVKTTTSNSSISYTHMKLSKGKTYYYKVRAYRTVNGKKIYSPYTSVVSAKL